MMCPVAETGKTLLRERKETMNTVHMHDCATRRDGACTLCGPFNQLCRQRELGICVLCSIVVADKGPPI